MARRSQVSKRSGSGRAGSRLRLVGQAEPRICTPPLRPLTRHTTLGFLAIEFAENICGMQLYPWQKVLLKRGLELAPGVTVGNMWDRVQGEPLFRFRTVVVLVSRQNGKSALGQVLSLFFMYVLGAKLVLGTAQDLDTAEEVWEGALEIIEETPELAAHNLRPVRVNGQKTIRLDTGERYKVKAANRRAGRGLTGDLVLLDELREHQTFEAWAALTKTTIARPDALIWSMSSAGDATSLPLRHLRKKAHAALGDPDGVNAEDDPASLLAGIDAVAPELDEEDESPFEDESTLGIFEWSAPPGSSPKDRDAWAFANPALGHGFLTERALAAAENDDPEWQFMNECMTMWTSGSREGPFPPGSWEKGLWRPEKHPDFESAVVPGVRQPQLVGKVKVCIEMSVDRSKAFIAVGGTSEDGVPQIELIQARAVTESVGTGWVLDWLKNNRDQYDEVTCQKRGGAVSGLVPEIVEAGLPYVPWEGPDLTMATGKFYDAVKDQQFRHFEQGYVDVPAATAVPKLNSSGSFLWDWHKSPVDVAPLQAFTGVWWLMNRVVEKFESAYESSDVMFV